ncbi:hypothetical protein [Rubrivirga sp.]|uniref:hypothetical protein n=1 Tax=Rubrivirga sp. TaxID=1885344 RepID=UPI003B51F239
MESETQPIGMVDECVESYRVEQRPDGGASIRIEIDPRFAALWMVRLSDLTTTMREIKQYEPDDWRRS